ncbi:MAG: sulfurtransferase TusA family protein [Crenarchaeota archaeon]|nr:sulfurtransferase TusA family protein [Thermoproteota archaeon]
MAVLEVDVRGLECPKAVTEAMKRLARASVGDTVVVIASSPECVKSLASSVVRLGIGTVSLEREGGCYRLRIVKLSSRIKPSDATC